MDDWSAETEALYDSIFEDNPFLADDPWAEHLFEQTFLEGRTELDFMYSLDEFEDYLYDEYGIYLDDDWWDDFRDWYDSQ